jgi:hypothetical protein
MKKSIAEIIPEPSTLNTEVQQTTQLDVLATIQQVTNIQQQQNHQFNETDSELTNPNIFERVFCCLCCFEYLKIRSTTLRGVLLMISFVFVLFFLFDFF